MKASRSKRPRIRSRILSCLLGLLVAGCAANVFNVDRDFHSGHYSFLDIASVTNDAYLASVQGAPGAEALVNASQGARWQMQDLLQAYAKRWKPGPNGRHLRLQVTQLPVSPQPAYPQAMVNGRPRPPVLAEPGTLGYEILVLDGGHIPADYVVRVPWDAGRGAEARAQAVRQAHQELVKFIEDYR